MKNLSVSARLATARRQVVKSGVRPLIAGALLSLLTFALPAQAQLAIDDAWVKAAGPSQMATAAYMTLRASQTVKITGAESPVAGVVELHQMAMGPNDTMTMRAVPVLEITAGQSLELKPGGLHVMLMDLSKTPLKPGDSVPVTLIMQTADGKTVRQTVSAAVRPITAKAGGGDGKHRHH